MHVCSNTHTDLAQADFYVHSEVKNTAQGTNRDNGYLYKVDIYFLYDGSGWGAGGDKVSYAKQKDLKGHPMKGSWRSREHRNLENCLCLLAFHTPS